MRMTATMMGPLAAVLLATALIGSPAFARDHGDYVHGGASAGVKIGHGPGVIPHDIRRGTTAIGYGHDYDRGHAYDRDHFRHRRYARGDEDFGFFFGGGWGPWNDDYDYYPERSYAWSGPGCGCYGHNYYRHRRDWRHDCR